MLKRDPNPLNERTKTASEQGNVFVMRVCVRGLQCFTGTLEVIGSSGIFLWRHVKSVVGVQVVQKIAVERAGY